MAQRPNDGIAAGIPREDPSFIKAAMRAERHHEGEVGAVKELRILNRLIRWKKDGLEYEADQRHAEAIVKDIKLENGRAVVTPCTSETELKEEGSGEEKIEECKTDTLFRSVAARLNFLAADRPDLQYASNRTSKHMSNPSALGWRLLKRVGRYFLGPDGPCNILIFMHPIQM